MQMRLHYSNTAHTLAECQGEEDAHKYFNNVFNCNHSSLFIVLGTPPLLWRFYSSVSQFASLFMHYAGSSSKFVFMSEA